MSKDVKQQSNPFSTGGGGVNFETRVQAAFAISLLTHSCVPCLSQNMRAKELKFQNKYDGSNTDDFVLVASDKLSNESRLYAQIKHEITISESQESMFAEVINSAWKDFKDTEFNPESDSIALITGPLSKLDINNTLPILEWAKYSSSSADFIKKSKTKGFTSEAKVKRLNIFRSQLINANEGKEVNDDELWKFLRVFYLVSFDLDAKHSIVANLLCSLIQCYSDKSPSLVLSKVVTCVQEFNQNAGVLTLENTPKDVTELFQVLVNVDFENDFLKFKERGSYIYGGISNTINGFHIDRYEDLVKLSEAFNDSDFLFVTGVRGAGKSGIVKDFISTKGKDVPVFYLRAEDLDRTHLNDVFASIGMNSTLGQIEGYFSLLQEKILVIESLEKVLELNYQDAFIDLLQFIRQQTGWTIIATGRDYAYQQLTFNFLQPSGLKFSSVNIEGLTQEQVEQVCKNIPEFNELISNSSLVDILKIPFFIEIAVRAIGNGAQFKSGDTEVEFRNTVWSTVISREQDRKSGMPAKRKTTFIDIAKQRAKKMVFGISANEFDPEVISKLEEDNLIYRDQRSSTISLPHDVLEDWALEEFIEAEYITNFHDVASFLSAIGSEPAISRAFRLWLYRRLKFDESTNEFVENILGADDVESFWKDETIAAILQHDAPETFLDLMRFQLLKDDCALLIRFCFILRITCQRPNSRFTNLLKQDEKSGILQSLFLLPYGQGWGALFKFIFEVRTDLSKSTLNHIAELINEWCGIINIYDDFPEDSRTVGLLAIWLLKPLKDAYRSKEQRKKILSALLKVSPAIEVEFDELMAQDVFISKIKPRRLSYVDELTRLALVGTNVPMLCKFRPDFIVKLSMHEWLLQKPEEDDYGYAGYGRIDVEESFGLDREREFFPASGAKGPFTYLLQHHPRKALDFIIELCNVTAQKYAESEFGAPSDSEQDQFFTNEVAVREVELKLNDGATIKQYASPHLWKGYRGQSTLPYLLQCALMALENWLVEYVSGSGENNQIDWIYDYLLRNSNSVMITSVLSSVATGFPSKINKAAFPLLNTADLYHLDLIRMTAEMGGSTPNWFGLDRGVMSKIYIEERREAALRPWRKESLETLLTRLQFDAELREDVLEIVDGLISEATVRNEKSLRYLVHRVDTRTWEAVEDKDNNRVLLQSSTELPEDLKQDQQEFNKRHAVDNSVTSLHLWSRKLFEEKLFKEEYFASYQDALNTAKNLLDSLQNNKIPNFAEMAVGTITTVAAVCIRDDLYNLSDENKEWCLGVILEAIFMHADIMEGTTAHDKTDYYGSGACAFVLPKLLELDLDLEQKEHLKYALATALTHENLNVCAYAAKGVREFLWSIDYELASYCLNGVVEYARFRKEESMARRFFHLQENELDEAHQHWITLITNFRNNLINGNFNLNVDEISLISHSPWFIHLSTLMIPFGNEDDKQIALFKKIVELAFESEYADYRTDDDQKIQHAIIKEIQDCLTEHIVQLRNRNFEPFKDLLISGCSKAPSFIYSLKLSFDVAMEKEGDFDSVWSLWNILAPEAHIIALKDVNDPYIGLQNDLNKLLRGMLYADSPWQGHPSEQTDMERGAGHLLEFARQSASNSHVFEALSSLIYNFHDIFFDKGIQVLAEKFSNNSQLIVKQINTAYYLEMSIGRYLQIENRGALSRKMYDICLLLLTGIVETGSARAYYLREHLIRSRKIHV